jgi:uncharacterized membrane protein YedE/YeeE
VSEVFANAQPVQGLIGGLLVGLAAAVMLLGAGRIAGVSGITARATGLSPSGMSMSSAWSFLVGLPAGALAVALMLSLPRAEFASWPVLVIAGVLVGFGTRLGSGCTSGHGVCGVSRLSGRSLVATATFMIAGIVTVAVTNMMMGGVS